MRGVLPSVPEMLAMKSLLPSSFTPIIFPRLSLSALATALNSMGWLFTRFWADALRFSDPMAEVSLRSALQSFRRPDTVPLAVNVVCGAMELRSALAPTSDSSLVRPSEVNMRSVSWAFTRMSLVLGIPLMVPFTMPDTPQSEPTKSRSVTLKLLTGPVNRHELISSASGLP